MIGSTLIIPDIHHKIKIVDRIVEFEQPSRVICLGDYWDDYNDSVEQAEQTARWVRDKVERGWDMLLGNHDAAYLARAFAKYTDPTVFTCPGYTRNKADAINKIMRRAHWSGLKLWSVVGKYVCSHAGFNHHFVHPVDGLSEERLRQHHGDAFRDTFLLNNPWNILSYRSSVRGGNDPYSGILWQDFSEFKATQGVHQIFGHTEGMDPRYRILADSTNICLDTRLRNYGIVNSSGLLTVKKTFSNPGV